jgi:predicted RNA-binding Zn ribbon-like protein
MMSVMTDQSAPGELELVREFVNTLDIESDVDWLSTGADARAWFAEHGVTVSRGVLPAGDLARLVAAREALRQLLLANNSGEPAPSAALETLNRESAETAIGLRFGPDGADLVTRCDGVDGAIAQLLAIVHGAMHDGTWSRLKVCPAEDCHWAFYDHSRNRSGTWCEMGVCGNRSKARAFRERHGVRSTR